MTKKEKKENLSVEGLRQALKNVNSGKAAGPDGLRFINLKPPALRSAVLSLPIKADIKISHD